LVLALVLVAGLAYGQQTFRMQAHDSEIEVLSPAVFEARFGNNPHIPRTEKDILALAQKLYPPEALKQKAPAVTGEIAAKCGREDMGLLFAALQNPAVSDATRMLVDGIIAASIPPLPEVKVSDSGHFKISYTTDDPDRLNNVTPVQINSLAAHLDTWWYKYATTFKAPKAGPTVDGVKRINVKVYYLGKYLGGRTFSGLNLIELNSFSCVAKSCLRRTTSAHELFHRVQYAYGLIDSTDNMDWIAEGTADWSQKFTNQGYWDYMASMNDGLRDPNLDLIVKRAYDACHFWVYLQERSSWTAIKEVWAAYQTNGKNAKNAVDTVTKARLGLTFDKYATKWSLANYIKDLTNADSDGYDYLENADNGISCRVQYGPLGKVPVTAATIAPGSSFTQAGSVLPYGARYHVFDLESAVREPFLTFRGTGSFAVSFIGMKNNAWEDIRSTTATTYTYKRYLDAGEWDKLAVVVMGTTKAGDYTLQVGTCIEGTWTDNWNNFYTLTEWGATIKGILQPYNCTTYTVTGTYTPPNITLTATTPPSETCCGTFTLKGTVTDCNTISGTVTNTCGQSGSFIMTKVAADAAMLEPVDNLPVEGPPPTSR
jgi:hypothetical protein